MIDLSSLKRVVVFGGKGASGQAATKLLSSFGISVTSLDGEDLFPNDDFDLAVTSPGVALNHPWQIESRHRSIPIISELQLGVEQLRKLGGTLVAVTGSKGKSSVVKLVTDALNANGRLAVSCGNYGKPVCEVAFEYLTSLPPIAVTEVSSFQMETTFLDTDSFLAAVVLNLQEDHLDRHGDVKTYHALKMRLLDCASIKLVGWQVDGSLVPIGTYFDNPILRSNGACAIGLLTALGLDLDSIRRAFVDFKSLPHRFQKVMVWNGVEYIDDSKATSLAALAAGVMMANGRPVRLIAGGLEKGDDPNSLISFLQNRVKKVYIIGHCAELFFQAWSKLIPCEKCGTLEVAFDAALRDARFGETVLLSPGAASFDQFKSFGERGDCFAALVKKRKEKDEC